MWPGMSGPSSTTAWRLARAENIDANPTTVVQRAGSFASASSGLTRTTLLVRRTESGIAGYLIAEGEAPDAQRAATYLAQAVGARAEPAEVPDGLGEDLVVGWLEFESGSAVAREVQSGVNPAETSRLLAAALGRDEWVAIALRKPSKKERSRWTAWLAHRLSTAVPTHHSMTPDATVVSVYAGGPDAHTVRSLLDATRSAMPGFDVSTTTRIATRIGAALPCWIPAAVALVLGVSSVVVPQVADAIGNRLVGSLAVALVCGAIGAGRFAGVLPSAWKRATDAAAAAVMPNPAKRSTRPKPPRRAVTSGDKQVEAREGDYPLARSSFMVGPQVVVGIIAPQAGAVSGEKTTGYREVPPRMLERIGPMIGDSHSGPAHLSAADAFAGTAILGKAGSGKSVLTRSLFGWCCLDRVQPSGLPAFPGERNALVAFESKGDGVDEYQAWADATGDVMVAIDIADPASFAIDLFAVPGTIAERANFFVNALVYAFEAGAIQDRSFMVLQQVFTGALAVTPEIASRIEGLDPHGSPVYYAYVLLSGRGDALGAALAHEILGDAIRVDATPEIKAAAEALTPLYSGKTEAARRNLVEAAQNKIQQLLQLDSWWSPSRAKVTWEQILDNHRAVVINTGTSRTGRIVEDRLTAQMSSLLMYSLQHAIRRTCSGWQSQGRSVSIFSDELSLLAGSSPEVITWLKDQGRSFGVRPFLATQRPEQLPDRVRSVLMNFSTLISYMQDDVKTAREVAENISGDEGEWGPGHILHLEPYTAVVRASVGQRRQSAFTVKVRNFEANRHGFATEQGYPALGLVTADSLPPQPALMQHPTDPTTLPPEHLPSDVVVEAPVLADPTPAPAPQEPRVQFADDEPVDDLMTW